MKLTRAAIVLALSCMARTSYAQREAARGSTSGQRSTPPRLVRVSEVVFPPALFEQSASESVAVLLELVIDGSGRVSSVALSRSSGIAAVDERVLAAARDFEFEPARVNGRPVAARITFRYICAPTVRRAVDEDAPRTSAHATATANLAPERSDVPRTLRPSEPLGSVRTVPSDAEQGVTVFGRVRSREVFRREVSADEVRRIPGVRGDALLAVQNLPGVARTQFGLGQFVVRSSAPEDSLVLLEGHPIALPFHLYGLASAIATDLIERIELVPGNFSTRFGRVSGGVINVTLRAPPRDRPRASVDVDVIDAGAFVSVPLGAQASVAAGVRASYLSLLAPLFIPPDASNFRQWPQYWDWQIAFDWEPSERDSIRVVGSGTDDAFVSYLAQPDPNDPSLRGEVGTRLTYHGAQGRWRHRFGLDTIHTFSSSLSFQRQDVRLGPSVRYRFEAFNVSIRDELELRVSEHARLLLGIDVQALVSDDEVRAPPVRTSGLTDPISPTTLVTYRAFRTVINPAGFAEVQLSPVRMLRILAGARCDYFSYAMASSIDPRVSVRWAAHPTIAVRVAIGSYTSAVRGYASLPGFGNPSLRPERWMHAGAGIEWEAITGALELDAGVFAKLGSSVVTPSDRVVLREGVRSIERFSNDGMGRVLGAELSARVRPGRWPLFFMLAYTLQRAERAPCAGCAWETYQWDQPHYLSASVGALLPGGFELGARVRLSSGLVEPVVQGAIYDAATDIALTVIDPTRVGRLPTFFSLDVRGAWKFRAGPLRGQLVLEVLNATNHENVESRVYSFDRRASQPVLGLPILPSLGLTLSY